MLLALYKQLFRMIDKLYTVGLPFLTGLNMFTQLIHIHVYTTLMHHISHQTLPTNTPLSFLFCYWPIASYQKLQFLDIMHAMTFHDLKKYSFLFVS